MYPVPSPSELSQNGRRQNTLVNYDRFRRSTFSQQNVLKPCRNELHASNYSEFAYFLEKYKTHALWELS